MKKLFKGAIPTIAMLLVAVMSLTSLTYAWFTAGNSATVDTVNVDVKSVDGLLVSANGYNGTWGSTLTPIYKMTGKSVSTLSTNDLRYALQDASTYGTLGAENADHTKDPIFYNVEYDNAYDAIVSATPVGIHGSSYDNWIQFNIYIKNEGSKTVTANIGGSSVNGSALSRAVARIALVQQGTASATAVVNDNYEPNITYNPSLIGIWEPNDSEHTSDGQKWLGNNGQSTTGKSSYMAVNNTLTKADDTYVNVATGVKYAIYSTSTGLVLTSIKQEYDDPAAESPVVKYEYFDSSCIPSDQEYYVYTSAIDSAAGEHFTFITIDSFFKTISVKDAIVAGTGLAKAGVYTRETGANGVYYKLVKTTEQIDSTKTYYETAQVATTSNCNVKVYTSDKYTANSGDALTLAIFDIPEGTGKTIADAEFNNYYVFDTAIRQYRKIAVSDFYTAIAKDSVSGATGDVYKLVSDKYEKISDDEKSAPVEGTKYFTYADKAANSVSILAESETLKAVDTKAAVSNNPSDLTFDIAPNTIVKLTAYIWIEGQDCDCTNYVAGNPFTVDLVFNKVDKATS